MSELCEKEKKKYAIKYKEKKEKRKTGEIKKKE